MVRLTNIISLNATQSLVLGKNCHFERTAHSQMLSIKCVMLIKLTPNLTTIITNDEWHYRHNEIFQIS